MQWRAPILKARAQQTTQFKQTLVGNYLLRGCGVVAVSVGDRQEVSRHAAGELRAPLRHPLRQRARESVSQAACVVKQCGAAEDAIGPVRVGPRHGVVVEHRKCPVEVAVAHGEVLQLLPCRHRSGKAAGEVRPCHVEGLHVDEGADFA